MLIAGFFGSQICSFYACYSIDVQDILAYQHLGRTNYDNYTNSTIHGE